LAKDPAEKVVKDIRRATRKQYSAEEKIRIISWRLAPGTAWNVPGTSRRFSIRRPW
jgi:transposase-like protein